MARRPTTAKTPKVAKPKVAKPKVAKPKVAKPKVAKPKVAGVVNPADGILSAAPEAIARLAAADRAAWQAWHNLVRYSGAAVPCSTELLRALLNVDDLDGWLKRVFSAYQGLNPDDGQDAWYFFREWFSAALERHLPPTHPSVLERAYRRALDDIADGSAQRAAALVKRFEDAGDSKEHRSLVGRALVLLARRLGEESDLDGACAAAQRAEDVFTQLGDATARAFAIRVRMSALLFLQRTDEALALLESSRGHSPLFAHSASHRRIASSGAKAVAADAVRGWTAGGYDWVNALAAVAEDIARQRRTVPNEPYEPSDGNSSDDDDDDPFLRGPFV